MTAAPVVDALTPMAASAVAEAIPTPMADAAVAEAPNAAGDGKDIAKSCAPSIPAVLKQPRRAKTNLQWARRFLPGTVESVAELPAAVIESRLDHPPGDRCVWSARYVMETSFPDVWPVDLARKTRSRKYGPERTEHQAFQEVVGFLWGKHAHASEPSLLAAQPKWVSDALTPCSACADREDCSFMTDARAWVLDSSAESEDSTPSSESATSETVSGTSAGSSTAIPARKSGKRTPRSKAKPGCKRVAESAIDLDGSAAPRVRTKRRTKRRTTGGARGSTAPVTLHCGACNSVGDHVLRNCPLVVALLHGRDTKDLEKALAALPKADDGWGKQCPVVEIAKGDRLRIPADGNCLFSAFFCSYRNSAVPHRGNVRDLLPKVIRETGEQGRNKFLEWVEPRLQQPAYAQTLLDPENWKTASLLYYIFVLCLY